MDSSINYIQCIRCEKIREPRFYSYSKNICNPCKRKESRFKNKIKIF